MITLKAIFGSLSSFFVLLGAIPYLKDIHQKKAHPHVLSWLGWAFITALGAAAMLAEGSTWAVAILLANTVLCLSIAGYSIVRRVGVWSTGVYDFVFFGLGILGLILWQVLDMPIIALVCAIVADLSFGLPTIIKTYKDPSTETPFVWATATISGLLSLFAVQNFAFHEVAYPLYLFIYDTIVLLLVLKVFRRSETTEEKVLKQYELLAGLIQNGQMVNKDKEARARAKVNENQQKELELKKNFKWWENSWVQTLSLIAAIVGIISFLLLFFA